MFHNIWMSTVTMREYVYCILIPMQKRKGYLSATSLHDG